MQIKELFLTLLTLTITSYSICSINMLSLYIHIPFCQSKCNYCAFSSFALTEKSDHVEQYLFALKEEIKHYSQYFHHEEIKTLYF